MEKEEEEYANEKAEQALLGQLLSDNNLIVRCWGFLDKSHFYSEYHGLIYAEIVRLHELGQLADAITLGNNLFRTQENRDYLAGLLMMAVSPTTVVPYAEAIRDCWVRRSARGLARELADDVGSIAQIQAKTEAISALTVRSSSEVVTNAIAVTAAITDAEATYKGLPGTEKLTTGVHAVDDLWRGLWPGQLYYLMARSQTGKSAFAIQAAMHQARRFEAAHQAGAPLRHVAFFSLEMTNADLGVVELVQTTERWDADQIKAGEIDDWAALVRFSVPIKELPIVVEDDGNLNLYSICRRCLELKKTHRLGVVWIDYRELIKKPPSLDKLSMTEWMLEIGNRLKALAKLLRVPIVLLCQLNKSRDRMEGLPQITDLPYGGEQPADAVFCLHRPEILSNEEDDNDATKYRTAEDEANAKAKRYQRYLSVKGKAMFGALKRRFGRLDWKWFYFDGPTMTFSDNKRDRCDG